MPPYRSGIPGALSINPKAVPDAAGTAGGLVPEGKGAGSDGAIQRSGCEQQSAQDRQVSAPGAGARRCEGAL